MGHLADGSSVVMAAKARLAAADEAYRVAMLRYREGKAILTEVANARAQLAQAKAGIAGAEAHARTSWSQLVRALGRT